MTIELRPFQVDGLAQYRQAYNKGTRHLGIAPTAFGKSVMMGYLAHKLVPAERFRFILVAHREALVHQNAAKVSRVDPTLSVSVEQAAHTGDPLADVISASIQTIRAGSTRLARLMSHWRSDGRPLFLIIDEAHHSLAKSYRELIEEIQPARLLGLTATPYRPDDENGESLREIYPELAFKVDRGPMIDTGWLAKPRHWAVKTTSSLAGIKSRAGDYIEKELVQRLNVVDRNELIINCFRDAQQELGEKVVRGVLFTLSVEHAHRMAEMLTEKLGWRAAAITGETPVEERRAWDEALRSSPSPVVLCSYGVLTEGWDVEEVNVGVFARPTKSPVLADQMLGRVLRLHPDKPHALVIDLEDEADEGRVSLASTFHLPPHWDSAGGELREDELFFRDALKKSSYAVRSALWRCGSRKEVVEVIKERAGSQEPVLLQETGAMWWDLGEEVRMVVGRAGTLVLAITDFGDYRLEWRSGTRVVPLAVDIRASKLMGIADAWLAEHHPEEAPYLYIREGDDGRPASDAQRRFAVRLGIPEQLAAEMTAKQARIALNQAFMESARQVERGIVGFGKYQGQPVDQVPTHYLRFMTSDPGRLEWLIATKRPELGMFKTELFMRGES